MRVERFTAISMLGALLMLLVSARPALADSSTAKAKQLFEDGVTSYNLGHYEEALTAFDIAYRLKQDAAFLFNIAQCQRNLRRYEDAQRTYRAYLRETPDLSAGTKAQIQQIMNELERAQADERAKQPPTGTVAPKTEPPAAAPQPAAAVHAIEKRPGSDLRVAGIAVGAVGLAAIIAGGVLYAVAKSANDSLNSPVDGFYSRPAEERRNTFQTLDVIGFAVGGAAVAAGVTMYVLGRRQGRVLVNSNASAGSGSASLTVKF